MNYGRMEVHDIVQETGIKIIPKKKRCKKAKCVSEEALHIEPEKMIQVNLFTEQK